MVNNKEKEVIENNILIGIFDGASYVNDDPENYPNGYYIGELAEMLPEDWQYHKSYDWLLPVVEKIESLGYPVEITLNKCKIYIDTFYLMQSVGFPDKISAVYSQVVEFIKWYNENGTKEN